MTVYIYIHRLVDSGKGPCFCSPPPKPLEISHERINNPEEE